MEAKMKRLYLLLALIMALAVALNAEQLKFSDYQNEIRLLDNSSDHMVLELTLGHAESQPVQINGRTWHNLFLKKEGLTLQAGYPQLPVLAGSVIIPNTAKMALSLQDSEYIELNLPVAPSKGNLTRDIDPATVPYTFADFYNGNEAWPRETSYLTEPFIIRDYRGITVRFQPFVYYPATQTLRVYTRLRVALDNVGTDLTNSLPVPHNSYAEAFSGIYQNMFLNFGQAKYPVLGEQGRILVIKHSMFDTVLQTWVDWKRQNGYTVDVVDVTVAGPTATQIKTYIQNQYSLNNGLMFVQIMGDAPQVPSLTSGGGGSDPSYALLAGGDTYPDIYVGRFSAQTTAELQTQIDRSIYYERDMQTGNDWAQRGMGIADAASTSGDMGETDQTHMNNIRTDLLNYGYLSVDQMYESTGATAAQVTTNLNQGRGFINYVGHGSNTSWVTTGYSNTQVNALTNDNKLPFIQSVACVNGNFVSTTCFAEAWLRSVNETTNAPAGAIGIYASSINQSWNPPMRAQDETVDLLCAEQKQTMGGLFYNGSSKMIEVYGADGNSMYLTWHIFGDASLMVRSKDPQPLTATYNPVLFLGMGSFQVETAPGARVTLYGNGTVYGTGIVDPSGILVLNLPNPPLEPMDLILTVTAFNKVTHIGTVQVLPSTGPYIILDDMLVTDNNNNLPEFGETVTLNFTMDNVGSEGATGITATLSTTDPYLTILNPTVSIPDITANGSGGTQTGFDVAVAANVPDQHSAPVHILIQVGTNSYEYDRSLVLNAPAFTWGGILVDDSQGNNNAMLDPGETVTLTIPFTNTGHAQASDISTALVVTNAMNVMEPVQTSFAAIPVNGICQMVYTITFSSQIPAGTTVNLSTMLFTGQYSSANTYAVNLGIVMENFETNFSGFPWAFIGGSWTIAGGSYDNSNCAKSATITHSQSTSMTVTLICQSAGTVSFWKKVSSEQNYDYLRFYLNGSVRSQWSGTTDVWSQVSFEVQPGANVFTWEYSKDSMVSGGSDCAWIDDIVFPSTGGVTGAPVISVDSYSIDFGQILVGETGTHSFTINNTGDAVLLGSVEVPAPFAVFMGANEPGSTVQFVIPAQSQLTLNLTFSPTSITSYSGDMLITTDDPVNPTLTVQLTGIGQPVANDDPVLPAVTELKGNWPNPFNPSTSISFSVKEASPVIIEVYNLKGQLVRTLIKESKAAGNHRIVFDGRDNAGQPLASGVYFYKMQAGKYSATRKMILMK